MARPTRACALLLPALIACPPQQAHAQGGNPFDGDPAAIRAGAALFANRCAECHGADAKGFSGPDLTTLWEFGTDDEYVFQAIRSGIPGSIMPSSDAPENEDWAIVAYVKRLSTVAPADYSGGDAEHGEELFAATCIRCHRVGGRGGRLGPDLSRITSVRSREALMQAIRDPDAAVARGYRAVTLVSPAGERIRGAVKTEDAFSIQIMRTDQRLQGYVKADLLEVTHDGGSLMPAFGPDRLGEADVEAVLAYLDAVRRDRSEGAR